MKKRDGLLSAALAAVLALGWQAWIVQRNYGGNWSGLFCIGDRGPAPPQPIARDLYRFANSEGYDGQFYYYIAHDPFLRRGFEQSVDNPPLRWRRILLPLLAHVLALGRADFVISAYITVVLGAVFAGTWWLSRFLQAAGFRSFWGLTFLAIPAVTVSLDRMTVDLLLAALCIGLALHHDSWKVYPLLLLAPLARETGLVLVAAFCLQRALSRRYREAALGAAMALPWLAWSVYLRFRLWPDGTPWLSAVPFSGLIERTLHPFQFPITGHWLARAAALDYLGILGVWLAVFAAAHFVWKRNFGLLEIATLLFVLSAAFVAKADVWAESYAFSRTMTPLLLWPALIGVSTRSWWMLLPLALNIPRIAQQIVTISV